MTKIPRSRNRFELALTVLGISEAIIFASRTVLSYFLVSVLPVGLQQPNETAVLTQLAKSVSFAGDWTYTILTGGGLFSRIGVSITAISIPVAAADVIFIVALLFICFTKSNELTENAPNVLIRFSIAFAIVNAFAIPVLAQDFWLSVAWGNMITASVNPYYIDISPEFLQGIPLDALAQRMTYGPLWALISGFISLVTFKSSFFAAIGFKLLLTGLWISTLRLIQQLTAGQSIRERCISIAAFGWLPLSTIEAAAEGHNDVVMVFFLVLYLYLCQRNNTTAGAVALTASVLVKYVTAPIVLLHLLFLFKSPRQKLTNYLPDVIFPLILTIAVFAPFYRSLDFFSVNVQMRTWYFFTPAKSMGFLIGLINGPQFLTYMPVAILAASAVYAVGKLYLDPLVSNLNLAALAVMSTVLYCSLGHVWPWFLMWVIPLASLSPKSILSMWNVGVGVLFPLLIIPLQYRFLPAAYLWDYPAIFLYLFPTLGLLIYLIVVRFIGRGIYNTPIAVVW